MTRCDLDVVLIANVNYSADVRTSDEQSDPKSSCPDCENWHWPAIIQQFRQDPHRQDHHLGGGVFGHHRQCEVQDPGYVAHTAAKIAHRLTAAQTRRVFPRTSSVSSSPASSSRMAALSRTTTSRRSQLFTLFCVFVEVTPPRRPDFRCETALPSFV